MKNNKKKINLKELVQKKYSEIANQSKTANQSSCCGSGPCCGEADYTVFSDDYTGNDGYNPDADLGLGCGIPTDFAQLKPGDHVLDLGSGAGNDCFVARALVGDAGHVIGLDFTDAMIEKAGENNRKMGYANVEFAKGDIEAMPFPDNRFDVILSNCVLNLVPDKGKAFAEIFRVLKFGGHFCISDVVLRGELPEALKKDAELYAGCVSGAIDRDQYTAIIRKTGFLEITIHKEKPIELPDTLLSNYLSEKEIIDFKKGKTGILSITISGRKFEN